jgi:putative peptidoglycan lipid II flippase
MAERHATAAQAADRAGLEEEARGPAAGGRLGAAWARLSAGGALGKGLGFIREIALAASFGTGPAAAAFRAAQTATLVPTHVFSSDALNAGFIPLCARHVREDPRRARSLYTAVSLLMAALSLAIAGLLWYGADLWAELIVPGFAADHRALTAAMLRAMAVGVPFYVQAALASYVEMAHGRYLLGAIRSALQNLGLLAGIGAAVLTGRPLLLAWGFTACSVLFAVAGVWSTARAGMFAPPRPEAWPEARAQLGEFVRSARPLLLLPLVQQAAIAVERVVASLIGLEAVAATDYARTLSDTGLALLAVPLGLAGLAELGRLEPAAQRARVRQLLRLLLLVTVPASVFLALHAEPIVRAVFARGQFGETSVRLTTLVLTGLALGFWAQVTGYVMLRGLAVERRNRRVAAVSAFAAAAHVLANFALFRTAGALGLGIAASAGGIVLLALSVHALGCARDAARVLVPLAGATLLYVPLGLALRGDGVIGLLQSTAAALAYWAGFGVLVLRVRPAAVWLRTSLAPGRVR